MVLFVKKFMYNTDMNLFKAKLLKCGFWKKSLLKNATLNSWTLSTSQKGTCTNESKHTISNVWNCPECSVDSETKNVFEEHLTEQHSFIIFTILNVILRQLTLDTWNRTTNHLILHATAKEGPSILTTNKTDDGYSKIFSTRKN